MCTLSHGIHKHLSAPHRRRNKLVVGYNEIGFPTRLPAVFKDWREYENIHIFFWLGMFSTNATTWHRWLSGNAAVHDYNIAVSRRQGLRVDSHIPRHVDHLCYTHHGARDRLHVGVGALQGRTGGAHALLGVFLLDLGVCCPVRRWRPIVALLIVSLRNTGQLSVGDGRHIFRGGRDSTCPCFPRPGVMG